MKSRKDPVKIRIRHVPMCEKACPICDAYKAEEPKVGIIIDAETMKLIRGIMSTLIGSSFSWSSSIRMQTAAREIVRKVPELNGGSFNRYDI